MLEYSEETIAILGFLRDRHNVLVSGPPGTGKSRLLNEVARAFTATLSSAPVHVPDSEIAIPATPPSVYRLLSVLPSPDKTDRKIFRTVFHQNSKYRDFISGLVPDVAASASGGTTFRVVEGTLYRASEHAKRADGAALLIIDEINRGPAVQVFGGSIVAIESDKRLAPDGNSGDETQSFEIVHPETGQILEYELPHHLYLLAAMNQADTSVEPLDVAFLRRWTPFRLDPSEGVLRKYFGLSEAQNKVYLPKEPNTVDDVYEAATRAWGAVNARIRRGRGPEFQIGHGILMARKSRASDIAEALQDVSESWRLIRAHVDEVFFGDVRGVAAVLNVGQVSKHPYKLNDATFADEPRLELGGPERVTSSDVYSLLCAVASAGD